MTGKIHAFMIFLGVLMMTGASGLYVRYAFDGPDPNRALPPSGRTADPTTGPSTSPPAAGPPTPTPTPTLTPSPSPTKRPTPTPTKKATAQPTTAVPARWRLVWSDDFSGSAPDSAKWTASDSAVVGLACVTSRAANVSVAGGLLSLTAQQETYTCDGSDTAYTAATLVTAGKASFTYGAFEIRAKSPGGADNSAGLMPVFWLHSAAGDIEVVEAPGGAATYRSVVQGAVQGSTGTAQEHTHTFSSGYPGDGFHTYRVEWESGVIRWYVDGTETFRRDRTTTTWFDSVFAQAFDLRLGLRVGGSAGDPDSSTAFPAELQVDYVRVYQR